MRVFLFVQMLGIFSLISCSTTQKITSPILPNVPEPTQVNEKPQPWKTNPTLSRMDSLSYLIEEDSILNGHFVGFVLHDVKGKETLIDINGHKYFTPASNLKLYTLLTSLQILNHKISTIEYCYQGDDLFIRGCGDPSFFTNRNQSIEVIELIQSAKGNTYYDDSHYLDKRYGSGWAWDDYPYSYQKEKSALPIYGNRYTIQLHETWDSITTYPNYAKKTIQIDTTIKGLIQRDENSNLIRYNSTRLQNNITTVTVPIIHKGDYVINELSRLSGTNILPKKREQFCHYNKSIQNKNIDSLYLDLMLNSDNFVGDQLLLSCSHELFDTMDTKRLIQYTKDSLFTSMPDDIRWVDGSGLSRYNLITPRSAIWVLNQLLEEVPFSFIKETFPSVDTKGTLDSNIPNVYAKTGTLSNNYNLSGYIKAKSGRLYTFSFMNNHYLTTKRSVDTQMREILNFVYRRY